MTRLLNIFLLLLPCLLQAQPNVQAPLAAPPADGFYRILLQPRFTAGCRPDLSDLRLRRKDGQPVAWLADTLEHGSSPIAVRIVEMRTDTAYSTILFGMPRPARSLQLYFANTSARRQAQLSGSRDRQQWFSILDAVDIYPDNITNKITGQTLSFPESSYPFLRLRIRNQGMDPMDILSAALPGTAVPSRPRTDLGALDVRRSDSTGMTRLWVRNPDGYLLDGLEVAIGGTPYFNRNTSVYGDAGRRHLTDQLLVTGSRELLLPATHDTLLLIEIRNGDNPPLPVDSVGAWQFERGIVAWLEKGPEYRLEGGDTGLRAPAYDLASFRHQIPATLPALEHGPVESSPGDGAARKTSGLNWIWVMVAVGLLTLALLTRALLKEVK